MAQFDVRRNRDATTSSVVPYIIDVQTALLEQIATRVVVPLVLKDARGRPAPPLNPVFTIEEREVVMMTEQIAGVSRDVLGDRVQSLADRHSEIIAALDFLFPGV